jgi:hypothetical protein
MRQRTIRSRVNAMAKAKVNPWRKLSIDAEPATRSGYDRNACPEGDLDQCLRQKFEDETQQVQEVSSMS